MNKLKISLLVMIFIIMIVPNTFAFDFKESIMHHETFNQIFDTYYLKSRALKEINFEYVLDSSGAIRNREKNYKDIIIGDITLNTRLGGVDSTKLEVTASLESIYLLTTKAIPSNQRICGNTVTNYVSSLPFSSPYNIQNKDTVITNFLLPLTRGRILTNLNRNGISNPETCFDFLVTNRNLIEYPVLLDVNSRITAEPRDFSRDYHFIVDFIPEFNNLVRPVRFNINFKKDPIVISSQYNAPAGCETQSRDYCYINYQDIINFNLPRYRSEEGIAANNNIRTVLNNFNVISNFNNSEFENINTKELIVDLLSSRENFCFREENDNYNKVIFDTAKAYNLSLEQTFQLWAIISEISNCNYTPNFNRNLKGFTQLDLTRRSTGTLFELDSRLPLQLSEEEQYQYLAMGDFNQINQTLFTLNNGNTNLYYNYGYDGRIYNDNTYFGFLIEAITKNKDSYGSTILFSSDYIKEINYLVKKSRELSIRPYTFENFILETNNSVNYMYILGHLIKESPENKNKIYAFGNFSEVLSDGNLFLKATTRTGNVTHTYIKTTKEARVLINYLAIKRRYILDSDFLESKGLNAVAFRSGNNNLSSILAAYERLDHNYWDTKKRIYLNTLRENNITLMLKKNTNFYSYTNLMRINGTPNNCAQYVRELGQGAYLNGSTNYPLTGADAWSYDTTAAAINTYILIWEAKDICAGKTRCSSVPTNNNCCYENLSAQDGANRFPMSYLDYLPDGAILGVYVPTSGHNNNSNEYTHVVMYIGKTIFGEHLMAHSGNSGQDIRKLRAYINTSNSGLKILRVYVPKSTGITSINQIKQNRSVFPPTYVVNVNLNKIGFDPNILIESDGDSEIIPNLDEDNYQTEDQS